MTLVLPMGITAGFDKSGLLARLYLLRRSVASTVNSS
jgi:hypothetical protein